MEKIISVVVPVYNVELYIGECIESILQQTYPYLEVILVDDGSTDDSGNICDQYAEKDERIKVIHKENGGLVSTRKKGIEQAAGEYLLFVDGDDWIEKETCEKVLMIATDNSADVVRFSLIVDKMTSKIKRGDEIPTGRYDCTNKEDFMKMLICSFDGKPAGMTNSICSQMTKTKLLVSFYKDLSDELEYGEDIAFVLTSVINADVVYITDIPLYHYRMRETSITHKSNPRYYMQVNLLYLYLRKIFDANSYKEVLLPQLERWFDRLILWGINHRFIIPRSIRIPDYMIPLDDIPVASRIVLYGAGIVGTSYYKYLNATKLYHIVGWIDKDREKCNKQDNMQVVTPEDLSSMEYDIILIAVKSKIMFQEILQQLVGRHSVDRNKIIWKEPIHTLDFFAGINLD